MWEAPCLLSPFPAMPLLHLVAHVFQYFGYGESWRKIPFASVLWSLREMSEGTYRRFKVGIRAEM